MLNSYRKTWERIGRSFNSYGNLSTHDAERPELNVLFTSDFTKGITYDQMANSIITITKPQTDLDDGLKCVLFKSKCSLEG